MAIRLGKELPNQHMATQGQTQPHEWILVTMCYMYITNKMIVLMKLFLLHINLKFASFLACLDKELYVHIPTLIALAPCNLGKKY
jgi:hypothetical protein